MTTKGSLKALTSLSCLAFFALAGSLNPVFGAETQSPLASPVTIGTFLAQAEEELDAATQESSRADWVHATNITPDTQ